MKFDIGIPTCREGLRHPPPFAGPKEIAHSVQLAERLGYWAVWGSDFINPTPSMRIPADPHPPNWYEVLISLTYVAAFTERIMLGAGVIVLPYRDVIILAKQVATIDQFSGGRFLFGIGLGQARDEFESIQTKNRKANRGKMLDEQLAALTLLLSHDQERVSFKGNYVEFEGVALNPKPIQNPLPIYISGHAPDTPSRVAKWGHGQSITFITEPEPLTKMMDELRPLLEERGRSLSDIDIVPASQLSIARTHEAAVERYKNSYLGNTMRPGADVDRLIARGFVGTPDELAERIAKVKMVGIDHIGLPHIAANTFEESMEQVQMFAEEVMPQFK